MTNSAVPDWPALPLSRLGAQVTSGSRGWAKYYAKHGDLFVRITNLTREHIRLDVTECRYVRVDPSDAEAVRTQLAAGDLLVSITADIGIIGYVDETVPTPAYINQHIARVRLDPTLADSRFVAHYLASWVPQRRFVGVTDTGAKAGMNLTTVADLHTLVPPVDEQRAIADALGDADALVEALKRKLAKKGDVREGIAQDLFAARVRLPGFSSPWTQIRLRDIGSTYSGLAGKSKADFGSGSSRFVTFVDVINNVRVHGNALEPVVVGSSERQNQVVRGDVLFNGSSETPEEVALGATIDFDPDPGTYLNSFCFGYRIARRHLVDPVYLAYMTRSQIGRRLVFSLAQGATRYNISKRRFLDLAPAFPSIEEQQAITAVLTDADTEIAALKQQLAKAKAIKEGMAQQLLTGRVRLPNPEPVA